ncbi:carbonic anhydrase [Candidatus Liberibacter americanus]|uniref:Carbonic anhydrase n=1 Tax=Candidatus Liberibacter americanus str. Sao Paulo TaxID=1261131 RepID=U6B2X5_9HYPH|nr:carbonic anhydrase [Candidatus Liberibacter americanus]AHA27414.1 Carbonic anhydrase [Candidatus Liberibacter americanus str. Sao Paulo]EMS36687.1 carbonate dehydratase [Candidatus Liberibacter americanus PW_SP]
MSDFPITLLRSHRNFIADNYDRKLFQELANQQNPKTMIISCSDSRVAPETIFNAKPGELFVVRNVANIIPPYEPDGKHHATSAAIEFAVQGLNINHIVVMGHANCGGIKSILDPIKKPLSPGDFIGKWMDVIRPIAQGIAEDSIYKKQTILEQLSIRNSINNLRKFPWINTLEKQKILYIHGAWFDISSGELWILDPKRDKFIASHDNL